MIRFWAFAKPTFQGIKPQCFDRIPKNYPEIRDIIDRCIRVRKDERDTAKQLLADEFFMLDEQYGIRVEIMNREAEILGTNNEVRYLFLSAP